MNNLPEIKATVAALQTISDLTVLLETGTHQIESGPLERLDSSCDGCFFDLNRRKT